MQLDLKRINEELAEKPSTEIIEWAHDAFGLELGMSFSAGTRSGLLAVMANKIVPNIPTVMIDTGYLFPESYKYAFRLTAQFRLNLKIHASVITPEEMEAQYGELWKVDRDKYNQMRKVEPMKAALRELGISALLVGVQKDETKNRASLPIIGLSDDGVYRIHPVLNWTEEQIGQYYTAWDIPPHPLFAQGYESVGDTHSTIPGKGRAGRDLGEHKECGLNVHDWQI